MSAVQGQQQYNVAKPRSKRLTIIDTNATDEPYWTIQRFYIKRVRDVRGAQTDTKKVRVKVREKHWPFDGNGYGMQWFWGKDVVFTHKKVDSGQNPTHSKGSSSSADDSSADSSDYDVYSGHIDDIIDKSSGWLLELYVTNVKDQT